MLNNDLAVSGYNVSPLMNFLADTQQIIRKAVCVQLCIQVFRYCAFSCYISLTLNFLAVALILVIMVIAVYMRLQWASTIREIWVRIFSLLNDTIVWFRFCFLAQLISSACSKLWGIFQGKFLNLLEHFSHRNKISGAEDKFSTANKKSDLAW